MIEDGDKVYAVHKIENRVAFSYGCGKICLWIDEFDGPGILLDDNNAIRLSEECFPLTTEEMQSFEIKFAEFEGE